MDPLPRSSPGAARFPIAEVPADGRRPFTNPGRYILLVVVMFPLVVLLAGPIISLLTRRERSTFHHVPRGSMARWVGVDPLVEDCHLPPGECMDLVWKAHPRGVLVVEAVSLEGPIEMVMRPEDDPRGLDGSFVRTLRDRRSFGAGLPGTLRGDADSMPYLHACILNSGYAPIRVRFSTRVERR